MPIDFVHSVDKFENFDVLELANTVIANLMFHSPYNEFAGLQTLVSNYSVNVGSDIYMDARYS